MSDQPDVALAQALVIQPGDTLIVGLATDRLTRESAENYKEEILRRIPDLANCVVIGGVTALAAFRPHEVIVEVNHPRNLGSRG